MSEQNKLVEKISNHMVTIENRKRMMLTGIVEVVSATDKAIVAKTADKQVNISGLELRVNKLNLEEGLLIVDGEINDLKYNTLSGGKSFFKRLFK